MESIYAKLISKNKLGELTEVYPEVQCDMELDAEAKVSTRPVANCVLAAAFEASSENARTFVKNALNAQGTGIKWNEDGQNAFIDAAGIPSAEMKVLAQSLADPDGAVAVDEDTDRLTVDFSGLSAERIKDVAESLTDQTGAVVPYTDVDLDDPNYGKLTLDLSRLSPERIKDITDVLIDPEGAVVTGSNADSPDYGLLKIDTSRLSAEQIGVLCLSGGGLTVDEDAGRLKLDFASMNEEDRDRIQSLYKVQTMLSGSKTIYVDNVNGSNDLVDASGLAILGKGESAETAFQSIQSAVSFITEHWAFGTKSVNILLEANQDVPYSECVTLPSFSRTTGNIHIKSADAENRARIVNSSASGRLFTCTGGSYTLQNLDLTAEFRRVNDGAPHTTGLVSASSGGSVTLYGCHCRCAYRQADLADSCPYSIRLFEASDCGRIAFGLASGSHTTIEYHQNNASSCYVVSAQSHGQAAFLSGSVNETVTVVLPVENEELFNALMSSAVEAGSSITASAAEEGYKSVTGKIAEIKDLMAALSLGTDWIQYLQGDSMYAIEAWGECTAFARAEASGMVLYSSGAKFDSFFRVPEGREAAGKRYECRSLSGIDTEQMKGSFPGTEEGTADAVSFAYARTDADPASTSSMVERMQSLESRLEQIEELLA